MTSVLDGYRLSLDMDCLDEGVIGEEASIRPSLATLRLVLEPSAAAMVYLITQIAYGWAVPDAKAQADPACHEETW